MNKKHKHAELIKAWADGAEIQFKSALKEEWHDSEGNPDWHENLEYRIKPETQTAEQQSGYSRLEWAEDLIKQLPETHDGRNSWLLNYGSKPEPNPDVVRYMDIDRFMSLDLVVGYRLKLNCVGGANLQLTFDGETGELKSAEVLK